MRPYRALNMAVFALLCLAGTAFASHPCSAQSDTGGSVAGSVLAPDGRGVAGALVRIEIPATGDHTDVFSDAQGEFRFAEVLPGDYRLRVHVHGLSDWEADNLAIALGTAARFRIALAPLSLHRTVLVDARRVAADGTAAEGAALDLNDLPNDSGHWSELASRFAPSSPGADGSLSFGGLSPLMNSVTLDGTDNNLAFRARERGTGGNGFAVTQSSVREFRTGSSDLFGVPQRSGFTTVTRSGADRMRGQATFYDRGAIGQTWNAWDKVMQVEPAGTTATGSGQPVMYLNGQPITWVEVPWHAPDRRQQWEVSAGGPIRRDRLTWFFAWEQHERHDPAVARASEPQVFFFPPSAPALATLEARLQQSQSPIAKTCAATGVPDGGSTAMAACAYSTVLSQLGNMLGSVPRSTRQTILFPKLDWRINSRNSLTLQYNSMRRAAPHGVLSGASEYDGIGSFGNSSTSDDDAVARWETFPTPWLLNSLRVQFSRDVLAQTPAAATPFEQQLAQNAWDLPAEVTIDRSSGFTFGTLGTVNKRQYPAETRQQVADVVSWIRGRAALRFGYDYNHVTDTLEGINGENGAYSYANLTDFISDLLAPDSCDGTTAGAGPYPCYTRYRQTLGYPNWWFNTADYALFVAGEWRPARRLTVALGARWEYERLPDTNSALINPDIPQTAHLPHNHDDLGPRAAFAWDLFGRGATVLRGGFGIYTARVPNATVFSALTSTGTAHAPRTCEWRPLTVGAPPFPYVFAATEQPYVNPAAPQYESVAPEAVYFDPHFQHPQIDQADVELDQELGSRTLLTLAGMATAGHHLAQFIDTNIDPTAIATVFYTVKAPGNQGDVGPLAKASTLNSSSAYPIYAPQRFYYRRLHPAYASTTDIVSESNSDYRGLTARLIRRLSRTLDINAGYTWGHAIDDNQSESAFADRDDVYDPAELQLEHGTSSFDLRQRVAGGLVLRTPWRRHGGAGAFFSGYSLGAAGEWRTGLPYTMRTVGALPTPMCSYQDWLIAGGVNGGANCLKAVTAPDAVLIDRGGVPIPGLGASLNGSGGEDLIPPIGRNTFRYPRAADLDLRLTKNFRLSDRFSFDVLGEAFNALNHQNVADVQTVGYRLSNDSTHANMGALTWQSGEKPAIATTLVNGTRIPQYVFDPTAAFGHINNANTGAISRERQIQAGVKLNF